MRHRTRFFGLQRIYVVWRACSDRGWYDGSDYVVWFPKMAKKRGDKFIPLIPMAFQNQFDVSLDVEENVVSLCSNCHNEIHYGRDADTLIRILYSERKAVLEKAGIMISMDDLQEIYGR